MGLTRKKLSLGPQTQEERPGRRGPGSACSEFSKNSPVCVFGIEVLISRDSAGSVSGICSQKMVGGLQCCRLKQEGMETLE